MNWKRVVETMGRLRRSRALGALAAVALAALLAIAAAGCDTPPPFNSTDITGASFGRDFSLVDPQGRRRTLADFRGKAVLMFFGYTQCPDVCPTAMARFAEALKALGPDAARTQVLFVTLDPERDTPEVLGKYVPYFNPSFLGLTGSAAEIDAVAREFRVYYTRHKSESGVDYTLDHWAGAYAFDAAGRLRLYVPPELPPAAVAADLRRLLSG